VPLSRILRIDVLLLTSLASLHAPTPATAADTLRAVAPPLTAPAPPQTDSDIPQPLTTDAFAPLVSASPFTRSLGVSDSLILTGIARFDNHLVATILDTQTWDSQVVSQVPNHDGWQLVGIGGDPAKMQTWSARIQVQGGQVITVRYQTPPPRPRTSNGSSMSSGGSSGGPGSMGPPTPLTTRQVEEARHAAVNYKEGFSGDGYPKEPPPEVVAKLSRLSVGQREEINRQMIGLFSRGMAQPERRRIYDSLVDRASGGRR
jgi:hypothetical protein